MGRLYFKFNKKEYKESSSNILLERGKDYFVEPLSIIDTSNELDTLKIGIYTEMFGKAIYDVNSIDVRNGFEILDNKHLVYKGNIIDGLRLLCKAEYTYEFEKSIKEDKQIKVLNFSTGDYISMKNDNKDFPESLYQDYINENIIPYIARSLDFNEDNIVNITDELDDSTTNNFYGINFNVGIDYTMNVHYNDVLMINVNIIIDNKCIGYINKYLTRDNCNLISKKVRAFLIGNKIKIDGFADWEFDNVNGKYRFGSPDLIEV